MSSSSNRVARLSRQQALRMRGCLAALLGVPLAGCPSASRDAPDTGNGGPVVVVPARDDYPATTGGNEGGGPTTVTDQHATREDPVVESAPREGRPGWKNDDGLYCQTLADSGATTSECGSDTRKLFEIPEQPGGMHGFSLSAEGTERERARVADACCYRVTRPRRGRPLRRADAERSIATAPVVERGAWRASLAFDAASLSEGERQLAAAVWADDAALEHASVAEFSRVALSLLSLGAPAELVAKAQTAALDEIAHAELAFGIASLLAGRPLGPGRLDLAGSGPSPSLLALVEDTIEDGCVGECIAAIELAVAAGSCDDGTLAGVLAAMADDEARHAELAHAIVRWAIEAASPEERLSIAARLRATVAALEASLAVPSAQAEAPAVVGRLCPHDQEQVRRDGLRLAVIPALRALAASAA